MADLEDSMEVEAKARNVVLTQLASAPRTRHELELKLSHQGIPESTRTRVLDRFAEVRLIDDAQFAADWVHNRSERKQLSRVVLHRELSNKGIAEQYISAALEDLDPDAEREAARQVVRRKLETSSTNISSWAERQKTIRRLVSALQRKGYPPEMALDLVQQELESFA